MIMSYLSSTSYQYSAVDDEIYQILGFLTFFEILWLIILPYNVKK